MGLWNCYRKGVLKRKADLSEKKQTLIVYPPFIKGSRYKTKTKYLGAPCIKTDTIEEFRIYRNNYSLTKKYYKFIDYNMDDSYREVFERYLKINNQDDKFSYLKEAYESEKINRQYHEIWWNAKRKEERRKFLEFEKKEEKRLKAEEGKEAFYIKMGELVESGKLDELVRSSN